MDLSLGGDLDALLAQLQSTQQTKASVKLSERNVVELVIKLKQLGILGDDLLHTINGKEYITAGRLKKDIEAALAAAGGRLELSELPALVGVDLSHCEKQAALIVSESDGGVIEAGGELMTSQYFDGLAAEVDDMLQESGVLSLTDLAVQYALSAELIQSTVRSRAGSAICGRLEGALLYTPAYVRNLKARLRGALRGAAAPTTLPAVARELGLDAQGGSGLGGAILGGLVEELVLEGCVQGALKGGVQGGVWTPAVYSGAQAAAVKGFYHQNGWVSYDTAKRMGVANDRQYLAAAFPDGIPLETAFASPTLLMQLDAAAEEVSSAGGWLDAQTLLPPALTAPDVSELLRRCHCVRAAGAGASPEKERRGGSKASAGAASSLDASEASRPRFRRVEVLAGSCVVAGPLLEEAAAKLDADAKEAAEKAIAERRAGGGPGKGDAAAGAAGGAGAKKGQQQAAAAAADSDGDDDWGKGGKKGGKKGKGGGKGGKGAGGGGKGGGGGGKGGGKGGGGAAAAEGDGADAVLSVQRLADAILEMHPDMEGAGLDSDLPTAIAELLRPSAVAAYQSTLAAAFTAGAEARRRAKDAAARALEEAFVRLQLYSHGCDDIQDDEQLQQLLARHAARTTGAECVDALLRWCQLEFSADEAPAQPGGGSSGGAAAAAAAYSPAERSKLVKGLTADLAGPVGKAVEVLVAGSTQEVAEALEAAASECGLRLRRLEKKSEKAALAAAKARLLALLAPEEDPAAAVSLAIPLLHLKATGRLVSVPGRAMGPVLQRLKPHLPEDGFAAAQGFLDGVVESLKQQAGGGGGGDAAAGEALSERLLAALPVVKALAGAGGGE